MKMLDRFNRLMFKIRRVQSRGLVVVTMLRWLDSAGLKWVRYNLYLEDVQYLEKLVLSEHVKRVASGKILSQEALDAYPVADDLRQLHRDAKDLYDQGAVCIGILYQGVIVGYAWYRLDQCSYAHLSFTLDDREAYVFGARTAKNHRWSAPVLFAFTVAHLLALNKKRLLSVTECYNAPAMSIRKKLRSRCVRRFLYVDVGGLGWNIELRPGVREKGLSVA